jgi:hypothetical protein
MRSFISALLLVLYCLPALADNTMQLTTTSSSPPTERIKIYRGQGITINYSGANQTIESAWLDNESAIGLTANGCLTGATGNRCSKNNRASILHIKQLFGSVYPGRGKRSLLTVETMDESKKRRIYRYDLLPASGSAPQNALTLLEYTNPKALAASTLGDVNGSPSMIATRLRAGLARAQNNNLVTDPRLVDRTNRFIALVEQGIPPAQAAKKAGVSARFVNSLYR